MRRNVPINEQERGAVTDNPIIVITIGDPAGIGPEVTAKALTHQEVWQQSRPLVVGDAGEEAVRASAEHTVRWAVEGLKREYFPADPPKIIDVSRQRTSKFRFMFIISRSNDHYFAV